MKTGVINFYRFSGHGKRVLHLLFLAAILFFSTELCLDFSYSKDTPFHTIVLNLGEKDDKGFIYSWHDVVTFKDIYRWGRSRGIELLEDNAPVVDRRARFISKFGSTIRVSNLKSDHRYRVWIDFVIFRRVERSDIISRLEIFMDKKLVETLNFGEVGMSNNPYRLEIPYDLSIDGNVEIIFIEHSSMGGFWGIWDLVVSDSNELTGLLLREKRDRADRGIDIKDRIVEGKNKLIREGSERVKRVGVPEKKKNVVKQRGKLEQQEGGPDKGKARTDEKAKRDREIIEKQTGDKK
jgi:hypothetical protein